MGVGIDLVSVDSVRESVSEHAERYLERVCTERELGLQDRARGSDQRHVDESPPCPGAITPCVRQTPNDAPTMFSTALKHELERIHA